MKLNQSDLQKIIAEEIQKSLLEEKMGTSLMASAVSTKKRISMLSAAQRKNLMIMVKKQPEVRVKKFSSAKHKKVAYKNLSNKIADYVTKNIVSVGTHTGGTVGLAAAGQVLQNKMVTQLQKAASSYGARSPGAQAQKAKNLAKNNVKFLKGAAGKLFAAFTVVELAHLAIRGDWPKFNSILMRNVKWWVAFKVLAFMGPIGWMAALAVGLGWFGFGRGEDIYSTRGAGWEQGGKAPEYRAQKKYKRRYGQELKI